MDDLVGFLRARLDEDEAAIRTWAAACWHLEACEDTGGYLERFDEKRMLAEVEAKRRIVDLHQPGPCPDGPDITICAECGPTGNNSEAWIKGITWWPCRTAALLALPYAGHPEYHEEWRP